MATKREGMFWLRWTASRHQLAGALLRRRGTESSTEKSEKRKGRPEMGCIG